MKNILLFTGFCMLIVSCNPLAKYASKTDLDYAASISQEDLQKHLTIYASDEFAGRDTGKESGQKAVDYLVSQYNLMGIGAPNNDHTQDVKLKVVKTGAADLSIDGQDFELGKDFINFFTVSDGSINDSDFAYVGYGIETENYSSFENVDVEGKVIVASIGEPKFDDGTYLLTDSAEPSKWSNLRGSYGDRLEIAKQHGATSMILVLDDATYEVLANRFNHSMADGQIAIDAGEEEESDSFYSFFANSDMRKQILKGGKIEEAQIINESIELEYKNNIEPLIAENVVAEIKGSEFPDEYIVISAHLDHVGVDDEGQIYNGADDDGSGTVAMLEIAQAFKQASEEGHRPRRSILFLHVTGEEKGLLGSQYYTDYDPIIPLENTKTNLNIDMIGRVDPKREGDRNYVYLIGSDKLSQELHDVSEEVNARTKNITLDYTYNDENDPNRFYYRSDHYNFAKNNIPIIFYFNGTHDDYHQPSDTVDKIEFDLLENRAQLVFYTAWTLANRDNAVTVDPEKIVPVE